MHRLNSAIGLLVEDIGEDLIKITYKHEKITIEKHEAKTLLKYLMEVLNDS